MCGRFALAYKDDDEIADHFDLVNPSLPLPCYNIAPSQQSPIIKLQPNSLMHLSLALWGLIPYWAKKESKPTTMINARAETIFQKPTFAKLFQTKRCLIPATGFFEWQKSTGGKVKQPYYFRVKQGNLLAFAGLFDVWRSPQGQNYESFTIITTVANQLVSKAHQRMPVILSPEHYQTWLSNKSTPQKLSALLTSYPADQMHAFPVHPAVNIPKNNQPNCIEPYTQLE